MKRQNKKSLFLSSAKISSATLISRLLGLVREQLMAHLFGASLLTDTFLVAYRIPNLLRDLFAEGIFSMAFIPTFTEAKQQGIEKARELLWALFIALGLITGSIALFVILFSTEIVGSFAPEFKEHAEALLLCSNQTKIMAIFLLLISWTALISGALNTHKIFFLPALAPAIFNFFMVSGVLFFYYLAPYAHFNPIYALSLSVTVAAIFQLLMVFIPLTSVHLSFKWPKKIWSSLTLKVFKKVIPGLVGMAANQINLLINTILATQFVGAVSYLNYAFRLYQFPIGVLGVSIASSNLVHFSHAWKEGNKKEAADFLHSSLQASLVLMLLALSYVIICHEELVFLVFQRGAFSSSDTIATAQALLLYSLGLPFYGLQKVLTPVFYTIDEQKKAVFFSLCSIGLNIAFSLRFAPEYGHKALALAQSVAVFLNALLLFFTLKRAKILNLRKFFSNKTIKLILIISLATLAGSQAQRFYEGSSHFFLLFAKSTLYFGLLLVLMVISGELGHFKRFLRHK